VSEAFGITDASVLFPAFSPVSVSLRSAAGPKVIDTLSLNANSAIGRLIATSVALTISVIVVPG
jgi:hypothetical protein